MHSIFWGVSDGGTWDARFLKRQKTAQERDMHRLIREKWKPFGEGMRTVISLEGILWEVRTKPGPPNDFREGEKSWHGKWVGGRWMGAETEVWLQLGLAILKVPVNPCFGLGELPSLVPMRVSPQARGQTHFALTPLCKQLGVLLAVLLPQKALPSSNFPTHLTTVRGRGAPPWPPWCGSSSHSQTKNTVASTDGFDQIRMQEKKNNNNNSNSNSNSNNSQLKHVNPREPYKKPFSPLEVIALARQPRPLWPGLLAETSWTQKSYRGSRRLWGTQPCFSKSPLQLLTRVFFNSAFPHTGRFLFINSHLKRHVKTTSFWVAALETDV